MAVWGRRRWGGAGVGCEGGGVLPPPHPSLRESGARTGLSAGSAASRCAPGEAGRSAPLPAKWWQRNGVLPVWTPQRGRGEGGGRSAAGSGQGWGCRAAAPRLACTDAFCLFPTAGRRAGDDKCRETVSEKQQDVFSVCFTLG